MTKRSFQEPYIPKNTFFTGNPQIAFRSQSNQNQEAKKRIGRRKKGNWESWVDIPVLPPAPVTRTVLGAIVADAKTLSFLKPLESFLSRNKVNEEKEREWSEVCGNGRGSKGKEWGTKLHLWHWPKLLIGEITKGTRGTVAINFYKQGRTGLILLQYYHISLHSTI